MRLYEYHAELFEKERHVTTEQHAFELLRKVSDLQDINYLAVPWAFLINSKQLSTLSLEPLAKARSSFTICQHVSYHEILPLLEKAGIDTLFTPHAVNRVRNVRVLPFPHDSIHGAKPSSLKDIFYSFIGMDSSVFVGSSVRQNILQMKHPPNALVKRRKAWHWSDQNGSREEREDYKKEYQDVLSRSRFSLCPRGSGGATVRFWESLEAGAIPVLISDGMRFPVGPDLEECIVRIEEKDLLRLPDILQEISKNDEDRIRKNGLAAYKEFSGDNLVQCIFKTYHSKPLNQEVHS